MKDEIRQQRILAVQRFLNGEEPESICASLGKSKAWLYKWIERHLEGQAIGVRGQAIGVRATQLTKTTL